jgi:uncharacterized FAD-dependent dehydrogenase
MAGLVAYLEQQGIDIITDADITDISLDDKTVTTTADTYGYGRLILAVGRTGARGFPRSAAKTALRSSTTASTWGACRGSLGNLSRNRQKHL